MTALLSVKDAAQQLGVSEHTLRRWCNKTPPPIAHLRVGGRIKFEPAHIDEYKTGRTVPAGRMVRTARSQRAHRK